MENIAVHCSWADAQVLEDSSLTSMLPPELISAIRIATGSQYLGAIATATRLPQYTDSLFALYEVLLPEIAARWLDLTSRLENIATFSCLVRILPFANYLRWHVEKLLTQTDDFLVLKNATSRLSDLPETQLQSLLLSFFRLLAYDPDAFSGFLHPALLPPLFNHTSRPVRYLAIQCLCQLMRFADAFAQKLVDKHCGEKAIKGSWEGEDIDYRVVKLFEEKRWLKLGQYLSAAELQRQQFNPYHHNVRFTSSDLSPRTAEIAGVLLPRYSSIPSPPSNFVQTTTSRRNLCRVAKALLASKPVILAGQPGSGKTSLIYEAARALNKISTMITLQLNEQTDAKSLLGLYTTSPRGGSFLWQPGVLTRAMAEGRWVLIEDIERAPAEVIGVLRPIIENGELYIPSRKEHVRPAEGFRILATTRERLSGGNTRTNLRAMLTNSRLWSAVEVEQLNNEEIGSLIGSSFPECDRLVATMMEIHQAVIRHYNQAGGLKSSQTRCPSLRDLLKWARRIVARLAKVSGQVAVGAISESTKVEIFKDAVDCYAGHIGPDSDRMDVAGCIASGMHISPQQVTHVLKDSLPTYLQSSSNITIGRASFSTHTSSRHQTASGKSLTFALTRQARASLEMIATATSLCESLLLVGETGVGKTTLVQHLVNTVGQKLTVVNLSQQSEATDLLGGLKPVTLRSIIVPLIDEFSVLFDDTFSNRRNEKFQSSLQKCVKQENWHRLLLLWQEALQMAEAALKIPAEAASKDGIIPQTKRRKLATPKYQRLRERWASFAGSLGQAQIQSERGESNLAFAFVEGRLVRAVRNGEWLLLDEINLASPETLDHIVSLLHSDDDGRPFLQLSDSGNLERIIAHPDFRIFAAMNPANDTGKRELAPGIRSRFTEIFIHPGDDNLDDLVDLIKVYLGPILAIDERAATDLATAYLKINKLNQAHQLTDGAGDLPHFTLRSLVRCLQYVSIHTATFGLRRSICEGFAMSFFTMLSKESEYLVQPILYSHVLSGVKSSRSFLSQLPKTSLNLEQYVAFKQHRIMRGPLSSQYQAHYIITPSVERNLLNLARATSMRRYPVLLQGPTSSGKTSMVEYLARLTGNKFVRVNNHEHTDVQEYLGSYASGLDGKLEYRDGVLVDALRHGHWVVLDELNLAPSDILEALNRLLDDNRELLVPESQEIVRPHPNFMLFATQNPAGLYGGRKRLSRAFRNRFLELHFDDIPEEELEIILTERSQIPPSFCAQIVSVYKKLTFQRQSTRLFEQRNSFATLRDLFRWAARPVENRQQLAQNGFMLLAERVRDFRERQIVKSTVEEVFKIKLDENVLYGRASIPTSVNQSPEVVWTPAMRRLFVLVSSALSNNEPVLLVGETGCGKTQICQVVALAMGKNLNAYNAHTNTETGDLIGSLRPLRNRSELKTALMDGFLQVFGAAIDGIAIEQIPLGELIQRFNNTNATQLDGAITAQICVNITSYNSLFQWVDGSLVQAMRNGEYFLLDEISLADDSVLERLNSVLEPSRTILLAEKGTEENFVVADPGFQFLATMNPGGDYGKRELSAALRNRLTEIWVPPLTTDEDVLPILEARLSVGGSVGGDAIARKMLQFAAWFREYFENISTGSVSLRTLLTWAEFIRKCPGLSVESAFVHGAAMVYIDSLGANPAGMTAVSAVDIDVARRACLYDLSVILKCDATAIYSSRPNLDLSGAQIVVGDFSLASYNTSLEKPGIIFQAPTTLQNFMRIVRALQMSKPLLLEGNPGVGKTAIITALAKAVGKELFRINLSDQTDLMDLFGADVPSENETLGSFAWRDGPLLQAMQSGSWVLLDEMNLASQSVLEGLNSCLDHRQEVFIADLDRTFVCHPEFRLFAAQNPHHQGGGRKGLPSSFVNRFTVVYADAFGKEDLQFICHNKYPDMPPSKLDTVLSKVIDVQEKVNCNPSLAAGTWEFNLRDVNRWLDLINQYPTLDPACHIQTIVEQRFRTQEQRRVVGLLGTEAVPSSAESLYHNLSASSYQIGTVILSRDEVFQYVSSEPAPLPVHLLSYAKSAMTAINNAWPVILSGASGSGKTRLIRHLAALSGARLVELSLNADIDTMDLIGGFEQYDMQRQLADLKRDTCRLTQNYAGHLIASAVDNIDVSDVVRLYRLCSSDSSDLNELHALLSALAIHDSQFDLHFQRLERLERDEEKQNIRFVWNDGILIDALQTGSWLVLDNANQCNASVLDRLNSLLEPNGTLVISEHHISGDGPRVITPHRDFRVFLTMDPRYGELSRAMRNRSLEVHIQAEEDHRIRKEDLSYSCASEIYRLRLLDYGTDIEELPRPRSIEFALEHVSKSDLGLLDSPTAQLFGPTMGQVVEVLRYVPSVLDERASLLYASLISEEQDRESQALSPGLNEPLLALASTPVLMEQALAIVRARQIILQIWTLRRHIQSLVRTGNEKAYLERPILVKSSTSFQMKGVKVDTIPSISDFLHRLCNVLEKHIKEAILIFSTNSALFPASAAMSMLAIAKDILALSLSTIFEKASFQAHLQAARIAVKNIRVDSAILADSFADVLATFGATFKLRSGRSLQRMWDRWRPITASSQEQLRSLELHEELVHRFEKISMTFRGSRKFLAGIRGKLFEVRDLILRDIAKPNSYLEEIAEILTALELQTQDVTLSTGHFASTFEILCQAIELQRSSRDSAECHLLSLFAKRPMSEDASSPIQSPVPEILHSLSSLVSSKFNENHFSSSPGQSRGALFKRLASCEDQPLHALEYATEELSTLATALCKHTTDLDASSSNEIQKLVSGLIKEVFSSHADLLTDKARACLADEISLGPECMKELWSHQELIEDKSEEGTLFNEVLNQYLMPSISSRPPAAASEDATAGFALITLSLAALKLLVPDQPFDPALLPAVLRESHVRRTFELTESIEAMRAFQLRFTGQKSSLIIRMFEDELVRLGDEPRATFVARPLVSELSHLSEVFSNLIRVVLDTYPQSTIAAVLGRQVTQVGMQDVDFIQGGLSMQRSISEIVKRLDEVNRAYDDLCKPVIWLLKCLYHGIDLLIPASRPGDDQVSHQICAHTPMLGGVPATIHKWQFQNVANIVKPADIRTQWLEHLALQANTMVSRKSSMLATAMPDYLAVIDTFHQEWKFHLEEDQAAMAEKARYYAYRGHDEDNDDNEAKEQAELFPTFDEGADVALVETSKPSYDVRARTLKVAELHNRIFSSGQDEALVTYLMRMVELLGNKAGERESTPPRASLVKILPGALIQIDRKISNLRGENVPLKVNIYTDGSIAEIKRLRQITLDVEERFRSIRDTWPEHAVPGEVLQGCREIFNLKLNEPVAKLLTKAEKLFDVVSRWEAVASRDFSAANLQTQLSDLIISWRRMELSSWSRLLDLETKKHEDNARAWYFMLYEAIFINTRGIMDADGDISDYTENLLRTLEDFLKTTAAGQFRPRLYLLESFRYALRIMSDVDSRFDRIEKCVSSILSHYQRYDSVIQSSIDADRVKLEKAIQEQIKMATWRDSNPVSLKDSARRSHNKLFRIVRKYRALLEKPVGPFEATPRTKSKSNTLTVHQLRSSADATEALRAALSVCAETFVGWEARPDRLTNPSGAALTMARLYQSKIGEFVPPQQLALYHSELLIVIAELRSQTPSSLTDENRSLLTNLKEQKKRLLADTFKALTKMGVKRNLGAKQLDVQLSTASVLSRSPDLDGRLQEDVAGMANNAFHEYLDLMSKVRQSFTNHSDDLTVSEVRRGVGLLEGTLSILIQQRNSIAASHSDVVRVGDHLERLKSLEQMTPGQLVLDPGTTASRYSLIEERLTWLPKVLNLGTTILEIHCRYANVSKDAVLQTLQLFSKRCEELTTEFQDLQELPSGLCNNATLELNERALTTVNKLGTTLQDHVRTDPDVNYILQQLIPWTEISSLSPEVVTNGVHHMGLENFDSLMRQLSDQVFVAIQRMNEIAVPVQSVEDNEWLTKYDGTLCAVSKSLQANQIADALESTLFHISHLSLHDAGGAGAILIASRPILEQYHSICNHVAERSMLLHLELARLAVSLGKSFNKLMTEGFCGATDPSEQQDTTGQLEAGTGLGEGEGAEDISKDIGDDEDLSELAGAENAQKQDKDGQASKDAVDMGPDELNGDTEGFDDLSDKDSEASEDEKESGDEVDEEIGDVDDLDPSAVDEKMWDDAKQEAEKELKGDKAKGQREDDQTAADENSKREAEEDAQDGEPEDDFEDGDSENNDEEATARGEAENMDPHVHDEQVMELPEDLQLNGEEEADDSMSDEGTDGLSDVEDAFADHTAVDGEEKDITDEVSDKELQNGGLDDGEQSAGEEDDKEANTAEDEVMSEGDEAEEEKELRTLEDNMQYDQDEQQPSNAATSGGPQGREEVQEQQGSMNAQDNEQQLGKGNVDETVDDAGGDNNTSRKKQGQGRSDNIDRIESEALKKLADVLERWHQRQDIVPASELIEQAQNDAKDTDMADADFEHVENEEDEGDAQASGVAAQDHNQNLQDGSRIEDKEESDAFPPDVDEHDQPLDSTIEEQLSRLQTHATPSDNFGGAFVPNQQQKQVSAKQVESDTLMEESVDKDTQKDEVFKAQPIPSGSITHAIALKLWSQYSTSTHQFSLVLTEQLRLILAPTLATKLRGDFRTGKRLNIKRIIPYIASQYKRDKIWLRRSVPSKRTYQIMIAVDDSSSMMEGGAGALALETVTLLCKSLSMLEVGEICVVAFGNEDQIRIAHPFGTPFSTESGTSLFEAFSFNQTATNVRQLIAESTTLFRDARANSAASQSDLWQLQLIVSDGHFEDHSAVQRLVRRAKEEKIMIVFVIVDSVGGSSIMDLTQADFEPVGEDGEMKLTMRRYLEHFPFPYYLVVRDVRDLPGVLATALKGWFAQVVDVQ